MILKKRKAEDITFILMLLFSILAYVFHAFAIINNNGYALWTINSVTLSLNSVVHYVPYFKDILAILLVFILFFKYRKSRNYFFVFLAIIIFSSLILFTYNHFDIRYIFSGIRNLLFVLASIMYCSIKNDYNDETKGMVRLFKILILLEFYLVFSQAYNTGNILLVGRGRYRFCGSFGIAAGLGYFIVVSNLYLLYASYFNESCKKLSNYIYYILSLAIVIATGSRTSMLAESVIIFVYFLYNNRNRFNSRSKKIVMLLAICGGIIVFPRLYNFFIMKTGRGNLMVSGNTRTDIMLSLFKFSNVGSFMQFALGRGLGVGTNAAYSLGIKSAKIMDGTISTLMAQFGILGLLLFLLLVINILKMLFSLFKKNLYITFPLIFSVFVVIFAGNIFEQNAFIIILTYIIFMIKNNKSENDIDYTMGSVEFIN